MSLTTPDGFVLKGTLAIPAQAGPRPVVLLAHAFGTDSSGWKVLLDDLAARGIATLALDLRGHGKSTKKGEATLAVTEDFKASSAAVGFDRIPADLAQAAAWVRRQPRIDGHRLGLAGASLGAYAALVASASIRPVAVLALSPAGGWGDEPALRLARAVETAKAAVFVMAAEGDPEALKNANAIKGIFGVYARLAPGKEHGFDYLPAHEGTMAGWFGETLARHPRAIQKEPAAEEGGNPEVQPDAQPGSEQPKAVKPRKPRLAVPEGAKPEAAKDDGAKTATPKPSHAKPKPGKTEADKMPTEEVSR
jgi:dienelactone hydrolase